MPLVVQQQSSMVGIVHQALAIVNDPKHSVWICPLLLVADAVLTAGVIWKIPYTEIDWRAYVEQIETYLAGEYNYAKISGSTGPLVYPAAHVYIYRLLYRLTSSGSDILTAQLIFGGLYLLTLGLVFTAYRAARVPPYVFPLLVLSKRLHSVYVLRLFNDCWAVLFLWAAVLAFQRRYWRAGAVLYSVGLGVKMSLLLVLPAVVALAFLGRGGARGALETLALVVQVQVLLGLPFLARYPREYVGRAFEFSRVFLWKWTVNWRVVGKDVFLSSEFAVTLLVVHVSLLLLFGLTRWLKPSGLTVLEAVGTLFNPLSREKQAAIERRVTSDFVLTTILSANAIGMLCARSLHYQFYSWLAWGSPFLLWRAGLHPVLLYTVWAAQEIAWNVYPSTSSSSLVVVGALAVQVVGIWLGTGHDLRRGVQRDGRRATKPASDQKSR